MAAALAFCPCLKGLVADWERSSERKATKHRLRAGGEFSRRAKWFGVGMGNAKVVARLHAEADTVLQWRELDKEDWREVDLLDVKVVDKSGDKGLSLVSRTGDLLLQLEAGQAETRDTWADDLTVLCQELRENPLARREATQSVKDRLKSQAVKQAHTQQRQLELARAKRDAEARKAQHMEGLKGLQYTAIAMANRP